MTICSRGSVVLVLFPNSDLRTSKRRPVVVVQADTVDNGLEQTIMAMITSNPAREFGDGRIPVEAKSRDGQQMGLLTDSVIMLDNLVTIREVEIDRQIGVCELMSTVDAELRRVLAI